VRTRDSSGPDVLRRRRYKAARESRGTSEGTLHTAVIEALEREGARGSALDFGAGNGALAESLYHNGRFEDVTVVDLVDYGVPRSVGIQHTFADLNEPLPFADGTFDTIVAVEVIEHLENPRAVAREWFRLLRPHGLVVATTPNVESWRSILSLVFRKHFIAFTSANYPAHIVALTQLDLARTLGEAGFSEPTFFYSERGALPRATFTTWQAVSFGRLRGVRYSDNIGVTARKHVDD